MVTVVYDQECTRIVRERTKNMLNYTLTIWQIGVLFSWIVGKPYECGSMVSYSIIFL